MQQVDPEEIMLECLRLGITITQSDRKICSDELIFFSALRRNHESEENNGGATRDTFAEYLEQISPYQELVMPELVKEWIIHKRSFIVV